ncbi:MAG: hypothetical protein Kow001_03690 [Acidobacteriota bacterium]
MKGKLPFEIPATGTVTQYYLTITSYGKHQGVDIAAGGESRDIKACASGKVVFVGPTKWPYGHVVVLYHGLIQTDGDPKRPAHVYTFYSHMGDKDTENSLITVRPGQDVLAGTPLGSQGNTGKVILLSEQGTGIHLD